MYMFHKPRNQFFSRKVECLISKCPKGPAFSQALCENGLRPRRKKLCVSQPKSAEWQPLTLYMNCRGGLLNARGGRRKHNIQEVGVTNCSF